MPEPSHVALISLQADALFRFDAKGRMVGTNEPDPDPAPRLFLGRTTEGNVWRFGHTVPPALEAALSDRLSREPVAPDLEVPPECLGELLAMLATQAPVTSVWSGPAWYVPDDVSPAPGIDARTMLDPDLLHADFPYLATRLPQLLPCAAVLDDGRVASVCSPVRSTSVAAEAGLHTLLDYRGRGYGGAAAATWARAIRASGRIPLYSTSWDNLASQAVARRVGLVKFGSDLTLR